MKVGTKVLASFEAGMNSPNLPGHVNITSMKHRSQFGEVLAFAKLNNSTVKCKHFLAVLLCFAKIFRESCVEKYKELKFESWHELAIAMSLVIYDVKYVCMSAKK